MWMIKKDGLYLIYNKTPIKSIGWSTDKTRAYRFKSLDSAKAISIEFPGSYVTTDAYSFEANMIED